MSYSEASHFKRKFMNILSHFKQRGFYLMRDVRAILMFVSIRVGPYLRIRCSIWKGLKAPHPSLSLSPGSIYIVSGR